MAGYEIVYTGDLGEDLKGQLVVYLAAGSNPMTSEAWETYIPPANYSLNTPRATIFSELHVLGSPYVPTGELTCWRRLNTDHLCRLNIDQGLLLT